MSTDCSANQPDCNLDDDDDAAEEDEEEGEETAGDVTSGDDTADCTVGDSTVGDSATGDSNQANAGEQDAANSNDQDFEQTGGNQANALEAELDQDAGYMATGSDGGEGGDAGNSGSVNVSVQLAQTLVRILNSILSGGDTIIVIPEEDEPAPTAPAPETVTFTCTLEFPNELFVSSAECTLPDPVGEVNAECDLTGGLIFNNDAEATCTGDFLGTGSDVTAQCEQSEEFNRFSQELARRGGPYGIMMLSAGPAHAPITPGVVPTQYYLGGTTGIEFSCEFTPSA